MFSPLPVEKAHAMLHKSIAREIYHLIEQYQQAIIKAHIAAQYYPNSNKCLDEKQNAQMIKSALYKLIDQNTEEV